MQAGYAVLDMDKSGAIQRNDIVRRFEDSDGDDTADAGHAGDADWHAGLAATSMLSLLMPAVPMVMLMMQQLRMAGVRVYIRIWTQDRYTLSKAPRRTWPSHIPSCQ